MGESFLSKVELGAKEEQRHEEEEEEEHRVELEIWIKEEEEESRKTMRAEPNFGPNLPLQHISSGRG